MADATGEEVMARFRRALQMFEGSHYFHNYTRRSAYAPEKGRRRRARGAGDDEDDETEGSEPMDEAEDTMGSSELDISGDISGDPNMSAAEAAGATGSRLGTTPTSSG